MRALRLSFVALCLLGIETTAPAQDVPAFEDREFDNGEGGQFMYRIYFPEDYNEPGRSFPLFTWINGSGGTVGDRPGSLVSSLRSGDHQAILIEPFDSGFDFQTCDGGSNSNHVYCTLGLPPLTELLFGLLDELSATDRVDETRRVLGGYSAGGVATFNTLLERPNYFSAAVPVNSGHEARRFRNASIETPIWAIHGHSDRLLLPLFSSGTIDTINQQGGTTIYLQPRGGHDSSVAEIFFADRDNDVYPWLFEGVTPPLAELVYDPSTGNVTVDASKAPGGSISSMRISAGRITIQPQVDFIGEDPIEFARNTINYEASTETGLQGQLELGAILPAGLGFTELHDSLTTFDYTSPASTSRGRRFQIKINETDVSVPLLKSVVEEPWVSYRVNDAGSIQDAGDALLTNDVVGGRTGDRLIKKFDLPPLEQDGVEYRVLNATLQTQLRRTNQDGMVTIWHGVDDNDFDMLPSDFDSSDYVPTNLEYMSADTPALTSIEVDVTDFVRQDYTSDGSKSVSSFRLQAEGEDPSFEIAMLRNRDHFPRLILSLVSTEVDCVADGVIDANDLTCVASVDARDVVLGELTTLPGDLDGNRSVDFADFLTLSTGFGQENVGYTGGDIDLNGSVDFEDFLTVSANFERRAVESVPEPHGIVWLLPTSVLFLMKLRRMDNDDVH